MRYVKYIIKYVRNIERNKLNVNFHRELIKSISFTACNCTKPILKFTQIKLMINEFMAFLF